MERERVAVPEPSLRPLGVGELLDRAVSLCVRNVVAFGLIYAAFAVPLAIVTYYASADLSRLMEALTAAPPAGTHHAIGNAELQRRLGALGRPQPWFLVLGAFAFFVSPLPAAALIEAATARYLGRSISFGDAYRAALGRWLPLLGLNVMFAATALALYVAIVIVAFVAIVVLGIATVALHAVGVVLAVIVGLVLAAAIAAIGTLLALVWHVAYCTCVVERAGVVRAFARGFDRVAIGAFWRRSLLVGIAYVAILIGILVVTLAGQGLVLALTHSAVVATVFATFVRLVTAAFTTAFVVAYYIDTRVRREGYDLQLAAGALGAAAPLALDRP